MYLLLAADGHRPAAADCKGQMVRATLLLGHVRLHADHVVDAAAVRRGPSCQHPFGLVERTMLEQR
jgi:hypothetical protein